MYIKKKTKHGPKTSVIFYKDLCSSWITAGSSGWVKTGNITAPNVSAERTSKFIMGHGQSVVTEVCEAQKQENNQLLQNTAAEQQKLSKGVEN